MYSQSHFHSTTHEVLCISNGRAKLCILSPLPFIPAIFFSKIGETNKTGFGNEINPGRVAVEVRKGDVVIIPAGVGHRLLDDFKTAFEMVGAYPVGKEWDMCYGQPGEEASVENIKGVPWFERDPLYGGQEPILAKE